MIYKKIKEEKNTKGSFDAYLADVWVLSSPIYYHYLTVIVIHSRYQRL